jgi:hypothetical protein
MSAIYDFALHAFETAPPWLVAWIVGWLGSWGVVQAIKFWMPLRWEPILRKEAAQVMACGSAAGFALVMLPTFQGVLVAIIAGLWSPISYAFMMRFVSHFWPWLGDVLSGDVRGVLIGDQRENKL